ncbi:hypothetical protein ARMSODRAFT_957138 [Armillaria solidipes]|uniref:REJ domain-containing protein n=1 Tax=Armillaria solidipes TaxID=1076256 RepID=A0A2H3C2H2_9AGAR|nr:hypothetical protein ARMSODRAFT_957138 [Armillaria solidipes]
MTVTDDACACCHIQILLALIQIYVSSSSSSSSPSPSSPSITDGGPPGIAESPSSSGVATMTQLGPGSTLASPPAAS